MKVDIIGCSITWTNRPTSCYLINENIMVDCGEGTYKEYKKHNISIGQIKNIFITHLHLDHCVELTLFIHYYLVKHAGEKKFLTVYGIKGIKEYMNKLKDMFIQGNENLNVEDYINIVEIENFSNPFQVEEYFVQPVLLKHGAVKNIAYIFNDKKVKVGFSGDCSLDDNVETFVKNSNVAFIDCSGLENTINHIGVEGYKYLKNKYPNALLFAIHCSEEVYSGEDKDVQIAQSGKLYNF